MVAPGAYAASLKRLADTGDKVRMLWQHDPGQPIGIWDEVREDGRGLWVRGRLLPEVARAREAAALVAAVREIVGDAGRILDLFSGCGTFALPLAERLGLTQAAIGDLVQRGVARLSDRD